MHFTELQYLECRFFHIDPLINCPEDVDAKNLKKIEDVGHIAPHVGEGGWTEEDSTRIYQQLVRPVRHHTRAVEVIQNTEQISARAKVFMG